MLLLPVGSMQFGILAHFGTNKDLIQFKTFGLKIC